MSFRAAKSKEPDMVGQIKSESSRAYHVQIDEIPHVWYRGNIESTIKKN